MADPGQLMARIALIGGVGIAALVIGLFVSRAIRRRMERSSGRPAFTLDDIRAMRESGQISEAEFRAMRAAILDHAARGADGPDDPGRGGPDSRS